MTAHSSSTTLPNGADLSVSITSPLTGTEFEVPPGQPTIDVTVTGTASVGLGDPDATFIYIMDVSGSTGGGSGTGCSPVLQCEQQFVSALNDAVIASGSADEAGFVVFANSGAAADVSPAGGVQLLVAPDAPGSSPTYIDQVVGSTFSGGGVNLFAPHNVGAGTQCETGLQAALPVAIASANGTNVAVVVSDGQCGGNLAALDAAIAALVAEDTTIHTIATGTNNSCGDPNAVSLQRIADRGNGTCTFIEDPGNLPDIIPNLIGTSLDSLTLSIDGNPPTAIPNSDIAPDLPENGPVSATYSTTAAGLAPGDHTLCVTATGSDVSLSSASVTHCETIHLLQLSAAPPTADNDLTTDSSHAVIGTIAAGSLIGGREITFTVSAGPNAGATGTCTVNADCTTDAAGNVTFTYSVPVAPSSIGTDTISVTTVIAGNTSQVDVFKRWLDLTPPEASCPASVNPAGNNIPNAGEKSPGQNEDKFYQVIGTDVVDPNPQIFVRDTGTGTVFGPYPSGTNIKYVEANGATPSATAMTGAVDWLIKGQGDAEVFAVDGSGNVSAAAACLVPNPPK